VRRGIARATRHAAAFLAGDADSLLDDCWWSQSGDDIYNNNSGKVEIVSPLEVAGSILVQKTSTAIQSVFHDFEGGARGALVVQNDADYAASRGSGLDVQSGAGVLKAEVLGVSEDSNQDGYGLRFFTTASGGTVSNTMTLWGSGGLALGSYWGTDPGADRLVVYGRIGIGTAYPAHKLDVAGDGNFSGSLSVNGLTGGGTLSADLASAINEFSGDSGSGGSKGAVPAPAAGDAAAGRFLAADGTWSTPAGVRDFLQRLGDGEGYIHSTGTVNGILYLGLVIDVAFYGPGKFIRMDPANPSAYLVHPYTSDGLHGGIVDWVYIPSKGKIYALFCNPSSTNVVVAEIDPDTLHSTDVISITSYQAYAGSLCTDGSYLYVACCSGSPSTLLKFSLSDWSLADHLPLQFGASPNTKNLLLAHNCRFDGTSVYISSHNTDLVANLAFVRVDPSTFTVVDGASLPPDSTNAQFTDDSAFTDDSVWYGSEATGNIVQVAKSNLASQNVISTGIGAACYGTYYDGSFIWACFYTSPNPGKIVRINPNTLATVTYQFGPGQESPNEIWGLGGSLCFTFWQDPALVSLCSTLAAPARL
jgi:hypothetical protein